MSFLQSLVEMEFGNPMPLKEFLNLELGEPFCADEGEDVREVITSEEDVPEIEGKYMRVAGIDRQKDHYWMIIRDYKPNGDLVLRMAGRKESEIELQEEIERWKVNSASVVIDTKYARTDTMKLCAEFGWVGYQGYSGVGANAIHKRYTWSKTMPSGQVKKVHKHFSEWRRESLGRGKRWKPRYFEVNANEVGTILCRVRDRKLRPRTPEFDIPRPALGDYADEYLKQIHAVRMVPKMDTAGDRFYTLFKVRKANHLFDCEKMAMTLAMRRGVVLGELQTQAK